MTPFRLLLYPLLVYFLSHSLAHSLFFHLLQVPPMEGVVDLPQADEEVGDGSLSFAGDGRSPLVLGDLWLILYVA